MVPPTPIRISCLDNLQMHLGTAASTTVLSLGAAPTSITVLQPGLGGLFPIACMIILYTQVYSIHIYACTVVVIVQLGMSCGECLSVLIGSCEIYRPVYYQNRHAFTHVQLYTVQ